MKNSYEDLINQARKIELPEISPQVWQKIENTLDKEEHSLIMIIEKAFNRHRYLW